MQLFVEGLQKLMNFEQEELNQQTTMVKGIPWGRKIRDRLIAQEEILSTGNSP